MATAIRELWAVLRDPDFRRDPAGLLRAWWNVATGRVDVEAPIGQAQGRPHYAAAIWYLLRAWAHTSVRG